MAILPLVVVVGGTGFQGGGCIGALLKTKRYRIRTITRNAQSKAAVSLAKEGVEVLEGNLLDQAFLLRALEGVDCLFASTISEHDGTEPQQGKNLGDAAVRAGVKLVVWSGGERIGVPSMDNKANIEDYLRTLALPKAVYLHSAFFFENVATKTGTKRVKVNKDRSHYWFSIPLKAEHKIPFISPVDIGKFVAFVIESPPTRFKHGDILEIAGDIISPQDYVDTFARLTGKQATYQELPLDFFRRLPIPGAELIVEMYEWYHKGCPGEGHARDPAAVRAMCPEVRNLEEWLQTDGIGLIDSMAYTDNWKSRLQDWLMWGFAQLYGALLRLRRLLITQP